MPHTISTKKEKIDWFMVILFSIEAGNLREVSTFPL